MFFWGLLGGSNVRFGGRKEGKHTHTHAQARASQGSKGGQNDDAVARTMTLRMDLMAREPPFSKMCRGICMRPRKGREQGCVRRKKKKKADDPPDTAHAPDPKNCCTRQHNGRRPPRTQPGQKEAAASLPT